MLARVAGVTLRLRQHKDELEWKMFIKQRNYEAIHSTANQKKFIKYSTRHLFITTRVYR